jgi:hypothetical protein
MTAVLQAAPRVVKTAYVARDTFKGANQAAPLSSPRTGQPLPRGKVSSTNLWPITDVENAISTYVGRLRGFCQLTSAVWGEAKVVGPSLSRVQGRAFVTLVTLEDFTAGFACGWDTATNTGDPSTVGHGWYSKNGELSVITPGKKVTLSVGTDVVGNQSVIKSNQYLVVVVLNDQGAWVLLSTWGAQAPLIHGSNDPIGIPAYPTARLLYADSNGTAATVYPYVSGLNSANGSTQYPHGHAVDDMYVIDLPSPWNTADGIAASADRFMRADSNVSMGGSWTPVVGTWGIASNQGRLRTDGSGNNLAIKDDGLTDRMITADLSYATGVARAGVILRYQDANNYVEWHNNGSTTGNRIDKVVAGVRTVVSSSSQPALSLGTTYRYTFIVKGARYQVLRDATPIADWTNESGGNFLTATKYGVSQFSGFLPSVQVVDNLAAYPLTVTLPAVIGKGAVPRLPADGATLASDPFTDTNGTRLNAHAAASGGAWTEHSGTWTISSNKATAANGTLAIATQNLGTTDVSLSVDITIPAGLTDSDGVDAGIVFRLVDASNYLQMHILQASSQVDSHELEFIVMRAGVGPVDKKSNIGNTIVASGTYNLKVLAKGDVVKFLLDGDALCTYICESDDPMGTRHGLLRASAASEDLGATFDNWTAKAL